MRNLFYIYGSIALAFCFLFFNIFAFTKKAPKSFNNQNDSDKINIVEENNKKIVENKNYDFDLVLDDDLYVDGYDQFIEISKEKIDDNLDDGQCILNFSTEKNDKEICDYIKNECIDLGCKKYVCEKYKNDWYKTIEEGEFFGTGDIIFAKKEGEYTYFLNLECKNKEDDNENNVLIKEVIEGFRRR